MQITMLRNPTALFHQVLMHHGYLSGGAAEADKAELEPVFKGLAQRDRGGGCACFIIHSASIKIRIYRG